MLPPTRNDRKVAIMVKGELARELFAQLGPDVKQEQACSSSADYRERRRGDITCVHTKGAAYECYFGLDLRTGKGMYGVICYPARCQNQRLPHCPGAQPAGPFRLSDSTCI